LYEKKIVSGVVSGLLVVFFKSRRLLFVILSNVEILSTINFLIYSEIYKKKVFEKGFFKTRVNFGHFEEVRFESAKI